jgi:hypothetical protein
MMTRKDYITLAWALRSVRHDGMPDNFETINWLIRCVGEVLKADDVRFDEARFQRFYEAVSFGSDVGMAAFRGVIWQVAIGIAAWIGAGEAIGALLRQCSVHLTAARIAIYTAQVAGTISAIAVWQWAHSIFGRDARRIRDLMTQTLWRPASPTTGGTL